MFILESYNDFLERVNKFEIRELSFYSNTFNPNTSLNDKFYTDKTFKKFYGDTVVFDLDTKQKNKISDIVEYLYAEVPDCFCQKLNSDTFHMTLHDLSNSCSLGNISDDLFLNEIRLLQKLKKEKIKNETIKMKSNYIINMMNTSLVLALNPINEEEYNKLFELYNLVDTVKNLPYPFTPHITLSYFNPNGFSKFNMNKLICTVNEINKKTLEFDISTNRLFYQKFTDMNTYINIFKLLQNEQY